MTASILKLLTTKITTATLIEQKSEEQILKSSRKKPRVIFKLIGDLGNTCY